MASVHELASVADDDHNAPSVIVPTDAPPIAAWALHGADSSIRLRRGTGDPGDFTSMAATQTVTFATSTSYAQLVRIAGDDLILFARYGSGNNRWGFIRSDDYGATWTAMEPLWLFSTTGHGYMTQVRVGDVLRCALWQFAVGDIFYLELDLVSGDISRSDSTVVANLDGTGLPYTPGSSDRIYDTTSGGARLLDISAATNPEVVLVTWTTDDDATYKYMRRTSGTWSAAKAIVAAGQGLGVQSDRYYGGASFPNPTSGGILYLTREASSAWFVEKHETVDGGDSWTDAEVATSGTPLVRPYCPVGRSTGPEVFWHKVSFYGSYTSWTASLHSGSAA